MAYYPLATELNAIYTLTGSDGTEAIFNASGAPNNVGMIKSIAGLDSPDIRESADDLVEADGGIHGAFYLGRRPVVINALVYEHATAYERALKLDRLRRACLALRADASLKWRPSWGSTNFVANPKAGSSLTNLATFTSSGSGTATRVTSDGPGGAVSGTTSIQYAVTGASASASMLIYSTPLIPNFGGTIAVRGSGKVTAQAATGGNLRLRVRALNSSGTFISNVIVQSQASPTLNTWYNLSGTLAQSALPAGTVYVQPDVVYDAPATAGAYTFRASGFFLDFASTVPTYFDGDTTGYYWHGTDEESTSGNYIEQRILVRRNGAYREEGGWNKEVQIPLVSAKAVIESASLVTSASVASGTGITLENRGNFPAYPIFRVSGGNTDVTIAQTGGPTLHTTGLTLAVGETIEIDTATHQAVFTAGARSGQSASRYIDFANTTGWPALASGNNTFTLTNGGSMVVVYRDAWA